MLIYLQPSYVNAVLEAVSCRSVAGESYILADVSYKCGTDNYTKYSLFLLVPFLIIWVIVLPAFMFYTLYTH